MYLLLAVASTWPLARHFGTSVPVGTESSATVALFNLWTIGWNVDRLGHFGRGYWNAPIFHPAADAFAFSEPLVIAGGIAAPAWWVATPAAAFNVNLFLALVANGWTTCQLLKALRLRWLSALAGGAMVEMLPFVHWQLGVLQLVPLSGIIWTLHALYRFSQRPTIPRFLILGLAVAVTYLLCTHYGMFMALLLILSGWIVLLRHTLNWRMWVWLVGGAELAFLLVWPEVSVQRRMATRHEFTRSRLQVESLAAELSYFTATPWPEFFPLPDLREGNGKYWMLSPGTAKYCLAAVGLAAGLWQRRRRGFVALCAVMLVLCVDLSFGPKLEVAGWHPYDWLHDHVPGYAQVRNIFRYAAVAQVLIAILAAIGLQALLTCGRRREPPRSDSTPPGRWPQLRFRATCRPTLRTVFAALLGFIAVSEVRPPAQKLHEAPSYERNYHWITWLKNATPPDTVLAHLPFPQGTMAEHYQPTVVAMCCQLWHHRPMVNGYSGFFPDAFLEAKYACNELPGQTRGLDMLRKLGVRYCVVDRTWLTRQQFENTPSLRGQLEWVIGDDQAGLDIYELVAEPVVRR